MKLAVAVKSAEMQVAKRMGHAPWFAVYNIEDNQATLLEMVVNEHAKEHEGEDEHHHDDTHPETEIDNHRHHLAPLKGVDAILARAVGPYMKEAISRENITVYRFPLSAGKTAPELMEFFIQNQSELAKFKIS